MTYDTMVLNNFFHLPEPLKQAVLEGRFADAEQLLNGLVLSPEDAGWLLHLRMEDIPPSLVRRIWAQCSDRSVLLTQPGHLTVFTRPSLGATTANQLHWLHTVLETALYANRLDIAQFLLEQGASLAARKGWVTPLEAAIAGGACEAAQWLLDHGVSTTPTERLMALACRAGHSIPEAACRLAGGAIWGPDFTLDGTDTPLPEGFTLEAILAAQNLTFLLRYVGCHALDLKQRKLLVNRLNWAGLVRGGKPECIAAYLGLLLTRCPELMRHQQVQRIVAGAALLPEIGVPPQLEPWVDRLPNQVELRAEDGFNWTGPQGLLLRWNRRLPARVRPVLSRKQPLPGEDLRPEEVAQLLHTCAVVAQPDQGVSPLLEAVLHTANAETLAWALDHRSLLSGEDPDLLKAHCLNHALFIREENRTYLMGRFGWKEDSHV